MSVTVEEPDVEAGIRYWASKKATLETVLGGFDKGSLPRVDALGSRQFLQELLPELCTVESAVRPLNPKKLSRRTRALDVGAGIGRVTSTVLLHLFHDVVLLEPVGHYVVEALRRISGDAAEDGYSADYYPEWETVKRRTDRSVSAIEGTLQDFDPCIPLSSDRKVKVVGRIGQPLSSNDAEESGFDVIWCQWCLGHMSNEELVAFFQCAKKALRSISSGSGELEGAIIVKENVCREIEPGVPRIIFDDEDSSLTRSDLAWKQAFSDAGLRLIKEKVQPFNEEVYPVKIYALR